MHQKKDGHLLSRNTFESDESLIKKLLRGNLSPINYQYSEFLTF